jgi:hypothetical protein
VTEACLTAASRCSCDDRTAREAGQTRTHNSILLSQLIGVLAAPLDCQEALRQVVRLLVPQMADFAAIDILADDGKLQRVAIVQALSSCLVLRGRTCRVARAPFRKA